jgi:ATP-binding cassette subfamily F protein 3
MSSGRNDQKISLSLDTDKRAGDQVLAVKELSKAFDQKKLWQSIGFAVARGERLGSSAPMAPARRRC